MTNNVKNTFIPITIRYPILGHRVSNYLYVNACLLWKMMCLVSCSDKTADKEQYGANLTELSHLLSLACPKQLAPIIRFLCEILLSGAGRGEGQICHKPSPAHVQSVQACTGESIDFWYLKCHISRLFHHPFYTLRGCGETNVAM